MRGARAVRQIARKKAILQFYLAVSTRQSKVERGNTGGVTDLVLPLVESRLERRDGTRDGRGERGQRVDEQCPALTIESASNQ